MIRHKGTSIQRAFVIRATVSLLLMTLQLGAGSCLADPIRLVTGEWAPYCSSNPDEPGITTEIVLAAFKAAGAETTLEFMPWPRCKKMIQDGTGGNVAVFPYVKTPAREKFALFSVPLLTEQTYLYYSNKHLPRFDFTGYEGLRKYRIGTLNGFVHQELFKHNNVPAVELKNSTVGLKMLLLNRIDLFPINDLVAKQELHKNFSDRMDQFSRTKTPLYEVSLHLMVSKKNPRAQQALSLFAMGMSVIRANGTVETIIKRYE